MTNKPQMKREVAVLNHSDKTIMFYATNDAASEFAEFGKVSASMTTKNLFTLWVDARFDIDEVLAYIKNYGRE